MIRLRKSNKNKVRETKNLLDLPKNQDHTNIVLSFYLDLNLPIKIKRGGWKGELLRATGTGYDGELQLIRICQNGEGQRYFIDRQGFIQETIPFQTGKILHTLKQLGYDLPVNSTRAAYRYKHYTETGISHLDIQED